ncbi:glycine zipper 2TM domain-containing protein [Ferrimonas lipolytica]|uniref:Glycine zipper 2TM domain-containing protein n=1 Tax=Ferrimonas lipolytica TaxID=2724191 RepID=A0A6H1UEL8_9GAMM|nr:glycine zipper 2TM domain-containing protein [Ferrimonas lipolytica]QIZ76656.1 glycine zipper 2TM domain-containing protein [Ferrimonas lipolytica]
MTYVIRSIVLISALLSGFVSAGYQRNQAVPVEKVSYGEVVSVRQITTQELQNDQYSGWKTFGGALLGGLIGNQFGDGSGRDVATVLGAIAGGGMARNRNPSSYYVEQQLLEMMIRLEEDGSQVMVVQDVDRNMTFQAGSTVRVVYLRGGYVRVDKAM